MGPPVREPDPSLTGLCPGPCLSVFMRNGARLRTRSGGASWGRRARRGRLRSWRAVRLVGGAGEDSMGEEYSPRRALTGRSGSWGRMAEPGGGAAASREPERSEGGRRRQGLVVACGSGWRWRRGGREVSVGGCGVGWRWWGRAGRVLAGWGWAMIEASCHCGAVRIEVAERPAQLTACNCSLCRRLGTLWAYYRPTRSGSCRAPARPCPTSRATAARPCTTAHLRLHHPLVEPDRRRPDGGERALMDEREIEGVRVRRFDGAATWKYLDLRAPQSAVLDGGQPSVG